MLFRETICQISFFLSSGIRITSAKSQSATWGCSYWVWGGQGGRVCVLSPCSCRDVPCVHFRWGWSCLLPAWENRTALLDCCPSCRSWSSVSTNCCVAVALKLLAPGCWDCLTAQTASSLAGCCKRPWVALQRGVCSRTGGDLLSKHIAC